LRDLYFIYSTLWLHYSRHKRLTNDIYMLTFIKETAQTEEKGKKRLHREMYQINIKYS